MRKERLDQQLVRKGMASSREEAKRLILAGKVSILDKPGARLKPSSLLDPDQPLKIEQREKYVSRGGYKLEVLFHSFHLHVEGKICLDVGSSTGGFVDCLLQHGARTVYCVDVGKGLLHWKIRSDPRVKIMEGMNARYLKKEDFSNQLFDVITVDVSFISLKLILPALFPLLTPNGLVCALIKPQFEAGKKEVGKKGVIRDEGIRNRVIKDLELWLTANFPMKTAAVIPSPILGQEGNQEYLWVIEQKDPCIDLKPHL
ncbi:TlyA family rRNA (cytidine-2'-O)-methyltransferase [Candidatus Methylacidiphilum fumarolicum]|uniref:rRNA methylase n=2 Tax=Candidatus Methylacidiphilum fumarolicum TaxID=591154 RepID=I0JXD5_METFB|nr:TlyA family RNA methyltransferase [Candidatus Methylacidiphilum fumarolicum]MBW6414179.1 TlyA family RNA methyltransferase [Candidatus Methylacidiphilum fumarolicum]TFE69987.1 rRNA methyltransferase [Candidatus Methylacidiphilum fumarolicum]TFE73791.1 TlyA family rRNA (cytidine-2'-O)-methyltransferase [Candidatus Methylacidiphilum fumarolicum]TFE75603.1 TlyA family rRNA (cytidine-2'-O)-methyltransferase [Candidatus Methylacidiphilum fumarolicum]TFE76767.1 rRNA methyltransferase [Candidatus 